MTDAVGAARDREQPHMLGALRRATAPPRAAMTEDMEHLRAQLAARRDDCFERLDDVVSELVALHLVDADEILTRVRSTIDAEQREASESESPPEENLGA